MAFTVLTANLASHTNHSSAQGHTAAARLQKEVPGTEVCHLRLPVSTRLHGQQYSGSSPSSSPTSAVVGTAIDSDRITRVILSTIVCTTIASVDLYP